MMHLDNLPPYIDSSAVSSLLTATTYSGRILGSSRIINLPNNLTVVASGNNVQASGEIAKRIVPIMLQPDSPKPEARQNFEHPDLRAYVREHRRRILSCLLGMVENWIAAGKPLHANRLGGFESWSGVIGGILQANGFMHWRENETGWQQLANPGGMEMERFVEAWHERFGTQEVTAKDLMGIAEQSEVFAYVFARSSPQAVGAAFGKMLQRHVDAPVSQWFIRQRMSRHATYRLEPIPTAET
jgi:DNA polymerase-1